MFPKGTSDKVGRKPIDHHNKEKKHHKHNQRLHSSSLTGFSEQEVLGVGIHSETLEELVVYKALYGERLIWVRPLKMFFETVEVDGKTQPRFTYLGK